VENLIYGCVDKFVAKETICCSPPDSTAIFEREKYITHVLLGG
jgi:hypothetical protein